MPVTKVVVNIRKSYGKYEAQFGATWEGEPLETGGAIRQQYDKVAAIVLLSIDDFERNHLPKSAISHHPANDVKGGGQPEVVLTRAVELYKTIDKNGTRHFLRVEDPRWLKYGVAVYDEQLSSLGLDAIIGEKLDVKLLGDVKLSVTGRKARLIDFIPDKL